MPLPSSCLSRVPVPGASGRLRAVGRLGLLGVVLLLAGCISSKAPLFPPTAGVSDFPPGVHEGWSRTDAGGWKKLDEVTAFERAGTVYTTGRGSKATTVTFVPAGANIYIVQAQETGKKTPGADYAFMTREGDFWNVYIADCAAYAKAGLAVLFDPPLTTPAQSKCSISSADNLKVVARKTVELLQPIGRYRPVK